MKNRKGKKMMKKRMYACMILLFGAVLFAGGCSRDGGKIATVNGKTVTRAQFDAYLKLKNIPAGDQNRIKPVLDDYLEREALAGLVENSEFIDPALAEAEVNEFRKQMLLSRYFENYLKDRVNDEAVTNYYNTHLQEYQSDQVKVGHILLRTNPGMSENELKALKTKAHEIYTRLAAQEDFAETAARFSEDRVSAKNGGSLGWIKRGAIDPVFSERVFALEPGEISEPFMSAFGFHIVRVEEGLQTIKAPLEKVRGDIRFRLRQQAKEAEMERLKKLVRIKVQG